MIDNGAYQSNDHDDSLCITSHVAINISDQEEQPDEADFKKVETSKCLVDCMWEEECATIDVARTNNV